MTSSQKVAVVTGSNKGIGFAVVELLCKKLGDDWDVYLTSRDIGRGEAAVNDLVTNKSVKPKFHQLDVDNQSSVDTFAQFIQKTYGGLDILVNNAAIAYKQSSTAPFAEQAEVTIQTNFWSLLRVCKAFFPLLRSHSRVVNVASFVSEMVLKKCSPELAQKLTKIPRMSETEVGNLMTEFVNAAKQGTHRDIGWPDSAYGVSKVAVRLLTYAQSADMAKDQSHNDVVINTCCPGYVDTDMSSHKGTKTIYEGADTLVYLATLPENSVAPIGEFVSDRKVQEWKV